MPPVTAEDPPPLQGAPVMELVPTPMFGAVVPGSDAERRRPFIELLHRDRSLSAAPPYR